MEHRHLRLLELGLAVADWLVIVAGQQLGLLGFFCVSLLLGPLVFFFLISESQFTILGVGETHSFNRESSALSVFFNVLLDGLCTWAAWSGVYTWLFTNYGPISDFSSDSLNLSISFCNLVASKSSLLIAWLIPNLSLTTAKSSSFSSSKKDNKGDAHAISDGLPLLPSLFLLFFKVLY